MACMSGVVFCVIRGIGEALTWNETSDGGAASKGSAERTEVCAERTDAETRAIRHLLCYDLHVRERSITYTFPHPISRHVLWPHAHGQLFDWLSMTDLRPVLRH